MCRILIFSFTQAANNLIVLAREESGAKKIIENGGIDKVAFLLDTEKSKTLKLTAVRILACLARDNKLRVSAEYLWYTKIRKVTITVRM